MSLPKPCEVGEQIADIISLTFKRMWREEPATTEELELLRERISDHLWKLSREAK